MGTQINDLRLCDRVRWAGHFNVHPGGGPRRNRGHISEPVGDGHRRSHIKRSVAIFTMDRRRARWAFSGPYQRSVGTAVECSHLFWHRDVGSVLGFNHIQYGIVDLVRGDVFFVWCWRNSSHARRGGNARFAFSCRIRNSI